MLEPSWSIYRLGMSALGHFADLLRLRGQAVLCLHSVTDERTKILPQGAMSVSGEFLSLLIVGLKARGIACVSLDDAMERLRRGDRSPFVSFTFDDGYRDNFDVAYPIFRAHNTPFAIFLSTGMLDKTYPIWWHVLEHVVATNAHVVFRGRCYAAHDGDAKSRTYGELDALFRATPAAGLAEATRDLWRQQSSDLLEDDLFRFALDWNMVREMHASGLVTFGGHTMSHPVMARLSSEELIGEVEACGLRILEETKHSPRYFAYPFGQPAEVGATAPQVVGQAGFCAAFTTTSRPIGSKDLASPFTLPRIMLVNKSQSDVIVRAYLAGLPYRMRSAIQALGKSKAMAN